jgi:hypothetical protein
MACRRDVHGVRGIEREFVGGGIHQPQENADLGPEPLARPALLQRGPLGDGAVPLMSSEGVDIHRAADQAGLRSSGLSRRIGEAPRAVPEVVEDHGTPGLSRGAVGCPPAVRGGQMVGGAGHGTPFAATARYLLAGYLKPVGPVERAFPICVTLSPPCRPRRGVQRAGAEDAVFLRER